MTANQDKVTEVKNEAAIFTSSRHLLTEDIQLFYEINDSKVETLAKVSAVSDNYLRTCKNAIDLTNNELNIISLNIPKQAQSAVDGLNIMTKLTGVKFNFDDLNQHKFSFTDLPLTNLITLVKGEFKYSMVKSEPQLNLEEELKELNKMKNFSKFMLQVREKLIKLT